MNRWCGTFVLPALAALLLLVPPVTEVVEQARGRLAGRGRVGCRRVFRRRQARPCAAFSMRHKALKGGRAGQITCPFTSRPRPALKLTPPIVAWLCGGYRYGEALQVGTASVSFISVFAYTPFLLWKEIKEGNLTAWYRFSKALEVKDRDNSIKSQQSKYYDSIIYHKVL